MKDLSDKIKDRVEHLLTKKIKAEKILPLQNGLFQLIRYSSTSTALQHKELFAFAKRIFPERTLDEVIEIENAESFDWSPCLIWVMHEIMQKLNGTDLNTLSKLITQRHYPTGKEQLTAEESEIQFTTDKFIGDLINFAYLFENNKYHLLEDYAIIPNQLNQFCKLNSNIFNDIYDKNKYDECERVGMKIPEELKDLGEDLGANFRGNLLHLGITVKLNDSRDLGWICSEIDRLIMANQDSDNPKIKQAIREIDRWIQAEVKDEELREKLFLGFYPKRHKIVYQTFTSEERANLDEIAKSGQSREFVQLVKSGVEMKTIKQIAELSKDIDLEVALSILKRHPELTNEKIEQLLTLEELSKGWNAELDYNPDAEQIRLNFENGWKGEAFVFKEILKQKLDVQWENKSLVETGNVIEDFEGEKHFIDDKKSKYDLIVKLPNGSKIFIQVKTTITEIHRADQIALPITTNEWKFVHETKEDELYYLARVFNIQGIPELYLMRLETVRNFL